MTLSATTDVYGRVFLSTNTSGSSFKWYKDDLLFNATGTGSAVDNRPQKNYVRVSTPGNSFTFTGTEAGFWGDACRDANDDPENPDWQPTAWTITIDGTPYYPEAYHPHNGWSALNTLLWGISGLANTEHTVTVTNTNGISLTSYASSDRSIPYGQAITYKVLIDDTTEETVAVVPLIDRLASVTADVNEFVSYGGAPIYTELDFVGELAGMYLLTRNSGLLALMEDYYDYYLANSDAYGRVDWRPNDMVMNGRVGYNFYFAWKAFKDDYPTEAANYLAAAEMICDYYLNHANVATRNGITGVWTTPDLSGAPNQALACCFSCALLYFEPASSFHLNSALQTRILHNAEDAFDHQDSPFINASTGAMAYKGGQSFFSRYYALYEWPFMRYLSEKFSWRQSEVAKATAWLNSLPISEPYFFVDVAYWQHYKGSHFTRILTEHFQHGSVSGDFIDLAYSAAMRFQSADLTKTGNDGYLPEGIDNTFEYNLTDNPNLPAIGYIIAMLCEQLGVRQQVLFPDYAPDVDATGTSAASATGGATVVVSTSPQATGSSASAASGEGQGASGLMLCDVNGNPLFLMTAAGDPLFFTLPTGGN